MQRHLKLVDSDFESLEKRVLPCFPFCYLIFKANQTEQHFEIKDISKTGMQLVLRSGEVQYKPDEKLGGTIHWNGAELDVAGEVKWVAGRRLGVEFAGGQNLRQEVDNFLSIDSLVEHLKPVHKLDNMGFEVPNLLRFWLRADGPVEVFVWEHKDGEVARFQIIIMENFVEWEDGKGLQSGRVISKRDIDTPLIHEDEFVFKLDHNIGDQRIATAHQLVQKISPDLMNEETKEFLCRKLS